MKKVFFLSVSLVFFLSINPALAYIDPGSGSAIISAIVGFIAAIVITIKTYWYKLKSFFFKKNKDESKSD
tara:strand:- start:1570 stop:1779 length:210 start_codon:yes stop_codon:yes gene_type:complete